METISWEDRDGARWMELEGEFDHEGCLEIRDRFDDAVADAEGDVVVVMSGVTFLSSLAVGMLLKARQTLLDRGHALRLSGVNANARRLLSLMNLDEVFPEL